MRFVGFILVLVVILVIALVLSALTDSKIAGAVALAATFAIVLGRLFGVIGFWPGDADEHNDDLDV